MSKPSLEETVKILKDMKVTIPLPQAAITQKKRNSAIDKAIEALNCSEMPNNSDCISRQAAIDIFDDNNISVENGEFEPYSRDRKRLCELPPAQPQYEELTPEEAASEIASGSIMSAWYWLDAMIRLKQMGYAICRKR